MRLIVLRTAIVTIIAFQVLLGGAFLFFPSQFAAAAGLDAAPPWTSWMLAMFSARALGFAAGLALAVRNPLRHRSWIAVMGGVQAVDWVATMYFVASGAVTLAQVSTASFVPLLYIVAVALAFPRASPSSRRGSASRETVES